MNRVISVILVVAASLFLSACKDSYTDELKVESNGIELADGTLINLAGQDAYNEQCASCHALDGNGTSAGSSLVGCATCGDIAELTSVIERTMPIGNVGKCSGTCASDTAEYIFYAFNVQNIEETEITLQQITTEPAEVTLRRASLQLSGALPSNTASIAVATSEEEALSAAIDGILSTDAFYDVLAEMFNKKFLTNKYLAEVKRGAAIYGLALDDYPNRENFRNYNNSTMRNCYYDTVNDSLAKEPLELVKYLARNNLPITELVTADYTMVNWYSQQIYEAELLEGGEFEVLDEAVCAGGEEAVYYDPNDFRPARITKDLAYESGGIQHAGVLTTPWFLIRYPTTPTNVNRHRARIVFDYFLDTDIMAINGGNRSDSAGIGVGEVPTMTDSECTVCHNIMDPVASLFQNWTEVGRYIKANRNFRNVWDAETILPPGFSGENFPDFDPEQLPPSGMLQWLGSKLVDDPRYARAMVRIIYEGIFGQALLPSPNDSSTQEEKDAFNVQRAWVNELASTLVSSNWSIKSVVKSIMMSSQYRAEEVNLENEVLKRAIGASQLLSPEQLQRKLKSVVGFKWGDLNSVDNRVMYGGINSDDVTEELKTPSGIVAAMQQRLAVEMACTATSYDFALPSGDRKLFPGLEYSQLPFDDSGIELTENVSAIKDAIVRLYWIFFGERLARDSDEINVAYSLYLDILNGYQSSDPGAGLKCRATRYLDSNGAITSDTLAYPLVADETYNIHAWTAMMVYLLSDSRFYYE
ncbi:DUF1553 domain-containing protein [uncultured Thalassolituus sp.]|uniref:DUF1553 domain-containing protein n=1 Tax=uncultured Thalassolituus sp. TaxID=285273 RepID=UPI0026352DF6|nr:DUF1553 domain-containing protein [uncultured Thalassolituus sp.]